MSGCYGWWKWWINGERQGGTSGKGWVRHLVKNIYSSSVRCNYSPAVSTIMFCISQLSASRMRPVKTTHTHTRLTALFPGLPRWVSTRKVKPSWTLLKQETVSGSGIGWTTCKSAPRSRQITMPAPHHSVFYRPDALPAAQPTVSKHWWDILLYQNVWFVHHQSPENSEWTKMFRAIMRHHVDSQVFAKHRGVLHWKCLHRTFVSSMECSQRLPLLGRIPTTPACFIIRPIK